MGCECERVLRLHVRARTLRSAGGWRVEAAINQRQAQSLSDTCRPYYPRVLARVLILKNRHNRYFQSEGKAQIVVSEGYW